MNGQYIGTKVVNAEPMNRLDYNTFRGWNLPSNENGTDEGYKVTNSTTGHINWQPAEEFHTSHKASGNLSFGDAVTYMKQGARVARKGWNGKGMFIFLVPGSTFKVNRPPLLGIYAEGTEITYQPHIDMKTSDGRVVPWMASQSDMLDTDWEVL